MARFVPAFAICIVLLSFHLTNNVVSGISFGDIKKKLDQGVSLANDLLGENGEIPRGNGCNVKWNIQGTIRGIEWKWVCTCIDKCTGITEVHTKSSRDGAMEHCFTALFQKLSQRGEL